jgi:hypothetical protein
LTELLRVARASGRVFWRIQNKGWEEMRIPCASETLPIYFAALQNEETNVSGMRWIFFEGEQDDEIVARDFDCVDLCSDVSGSSTAKFVEPGDSECAE